MIRTYVLYQAHGHERCGSKTRRGGSQDGVAQADRRGHRTVTHQRSSTEEDLAMGLGLAKPVNKQRGVVSGRVFSAALRKRLVVDAFGSGLNVERKPLLALVDRIIAGSVGILVLAHQDRLAGFGFPLISITVRCTSANSWC